MSDEKIRINAERVTKVVADVLSYLDFIHDMEGEDQEAIEVVQMILVGAFIDKVQNDNRICPF